MSIEVNTPKIVFGGLYSGPKVEDSAGTFFPVNTDDGIVMVDTSTICNERTSSRDRANIINKRIIDEIRLFKKDFVVTKDNYDSTISNTKYIRVGDRESFNYWFSFICDTNFYDYCKELPTSSYQDFRTVVVDLFNPIESCESELTSCILIHKEHRDIENCIECAESIISDYVPYRSDFDITDLELRFLEFRNMYLLSSNHNNVVRKYRNCIDEIIKHYRTINNEICKISSCKVGVIKNNG